MNIFENEFEVINEAGNKIFLNKNYVEYMLLERPSIVIANSTDGLLTKLLFKKGFDQIKGVKEDDFVNRACRQEFALHFTLQLQRFLQFLCKFSPSSQYLW